MKSLYILGAAAVVALAVTGQRATVFFLDRRGAPRV